MSQTSLVFFGSGPVAAKSLELLAKDFIIEAVVTKPKPAHHKGSVPVLEVCEKHRFTVFTPSNKTELSDLFAQKPVKSRLGVVIDYGIIISQDVIDYFPLGIVNSHFSLLPEWRGADPITFSILSGQSQTGVSLMLITAGMDEGPLLAQTPYDIPEGCTTPQLTEALIELSHSSLQEVLPLYIAGSASPAPQEAVSIATSTQPTYSRKLTKQDGVIDWNKSAIQIEREIRAFIEWPKSRTTLAGKDVVITQAHASAPSSDSSHSGPKKLPGDIFITPEREIAAICNEKDLLIIDRLKPAGKQEMTAQAFLAGYGHLLK